MDPATNDSYASASVLNNSASRSILIIDLDNDSSSIIAQCYLEILRAENAIAGNPWLFHRVGRMGGDHFRADKSFEIFCDDMAKQITWLEHGAASNLVNQIAERILSDSDNF